MDKWMLNDVGNLYQKVCIFAGFECKTGRESLCPSSKHTFTSHFPGFCQNFLHKIPKIEKNFDNIMVRPLQNLHAHTRMYMTTRKKMSFPNHIQEFFNSKKTYLATFLSLP